MLMTSQLAEQKKAAGFTHVLICVNPVNGWKVGDVMSWHKSEAAAVKANKSRQQIYDLWRVKVRRKGFTEHTLSGERMIKAKAEAKKALEENTCPACGNAVYVNSALPGWVQCHGYPADSHRKAGHESDAKCNWQGFIQ
jgi:hypothetical protein